MLYYLFGGLWCHALVGAFGQFVIASACCMWYFSQGTGQSCILPVSRSFWRGFRYHFGSICFGSFLLAVVRLVRIILYYIQKQAEKGGKNKIVVMIIKCIQCYVLCFERFIEFLNKNAYIQIAL